MVATWVTDWHLNFAIMAEIDPAPLAAFVTQLVSMPNTIKRPLDTAAGPQPARI
jgi:hypothetical protein